MMTRGALWATLIAILGVGGITMVSAATFTSPNFSINGSIGDSAAGRQTSTNYEMTSASGQSVGGLGSSGSYKLGQGYVSQLEDSLQLTVQPSGLEAYYSLDETSGTRVYDSSVNNRDGTSVNSPTSVSGKVATAFDFNGSSQYVPLTDFDLSGTITISAWAKPDTSLQSSKVLSKHSDDTNSQGVIQLGAGKPQCVFGTGGVGHILPSLTTITVGAWSHLVCVYDGSDINLYVNGVLARTVGATGALSTNNFVWTIGREATVASGYFDGAIDEVKIFDHSMTARDVKAEYDAQNVGNAAGISLGAVTAGTSNTANVDAVIQSDTSGYTLSINQNNNLTKGGDTIPAISGSIGSPLTWSEGTTKGLGFTLYGTNATSLPGTWSSGNAYAALPGSATSFYTRTGYNGGIKDYVNMRLRLDTAVIQAVGDYTNQMTVTGTMTP